MVFVYNNKTYAAQTASEIVREIEKDSEKLSADENSIRDFINQSLSDFSDQIHSRELVCSTHVSDETLALNYLCLLEEHRIGSFAETLENPV